MGLKYQIYTITTALNLEVKTRVYGCVWRGGRGGGVPRGRQLGNRGTCDAWGLHRDDRELTKL